MSEQKRSTPQRSEAPTQRRRSGSSPRRRPSRRGGMPQWLSGWLEHMALFFSTPGARIRRIGPRARTVMRESRARNFPESNRFLVQVFLVIGGMFPMWRSLLHERVMAHRRQRSHAAGEHEDRWRRHARRPPSSRASRPRRSASPTRSQRMPSIIRRLSSAAAM